jgi:transcriptional regulator with XRE-family HTH domain
MSSTLGQRLRKLRSEAGLTLAVLAEHAQISTSYLNDLEHDRNAPTLAVLSRIAAALDMDVRQVLRGVTPYG